MNVTLATGEQIAATTRPGVTSLRAVFVAADDAYVFAEFHARRARVDQHDLCVRQTVDGDWAVYAVPYREVSAPACSMLGQNHHHHRSSFNDSGASQPFIGPSDLGSCPTITPCPDIPGAPNG